MRAKEGTARLQAKISADETTGDDTVSATVVTSRSAGSQPPTSGGSSSPGPSAAREDTPIVESSPSGAAPAAVASEHQILLQLGEGGTAQVFLAVKRGAEGIEKLVVLKILKATLADNAELRRMFVREARFSAGLNHGNIVQTIAILQRSGLPAIEMEYLDGQSLAGILAKARDTLPLELHLRILIDALRGLHYAHELTDLAGEPLNVVHRDVSPQNIFVSYDGQVKLIDFGIVKQLGAGDQTATGVVKGKIRYMPPEQIQAQPLDRRVDLYAAGVLLWEAVARQKMWKGLTDVTIMHHTVSGQIPPLRDLSPRVPAELERIVHKALARDREDRYATAADLEADLESFLAGSTRATTRDVSNFVSGVFAEVRAQRKRLVNQELQRRARQDGAALDTDTARSSLIPEMPRSLGEASSSTKEPRSRSASGTEPREPAPPKRTRAVMLSAAALLLAGGVLWWSGALSRRAPLAPVASAAPEMRAAPTLTPSTPPSAASPPPPAVAAGTPTAAASTKAPSPHRTTVSPNAAAPPGPVDERKAAPPGKGCQPPFTIDADGTKRFKPECL